MSSATTHSFGLDPGDRPVGRRRLGDVLLARGAISDTQLEQALVAQRGAGGGRRRLGRVLEDLGFVDERTVATALAELHGLPLIDLDVVTIDKDAARLLPRATAERTGVLVYQRSGGRLRVAVADPVDVVTLDDVRMLTAATGLDVSVALESQVRKILGEVWSLTESDRAVSDFLLEVGNRVEEAEKIEDRPDAASIRVVDRIIAHAARSGASDVHVEPFRDLLRIRFRVDGVLHEVMQLPASGFPAVLARLKVMASLDFVERRMPQDGRIAVTLDGQRIDVRISTMPTLHGEKVVLRLLPQGQKMPSLEALGLIPAHAAALREAAKSAQGMMLITGPTGSGKTNTLYATMAEVRHDERNVITLEDPVEIELPGISQVPVDEKVGFTFAIGLRAVLRQDPDVVLVGEIRDGETAELAVRAALTGHLVLSTLHTLDAPGAVTRLIDMGMAPYLVASSLQLVLAQRLVRKPCPNCVGWEPLTAEVCQGLGVETEGRVGRPVPVAVGCQACGTSGYRGRAGVFELLQINGEIRRVLLAGGNQETLREAAARSGWYSLQTSAIDAALEGRTTIAEVFRVIGPGAEYVDIETTPVAVPEG